MAWVPVPCPQASGGQGSHSGWLKKSLWGSPHSTAALASEGMQPESYTQQRCRSLSLSTAGLGLGSALVAWGRLGEAWKRIFIPSFVHAQNPLHPNDLSSGFRQTAQCTGLLNSPISMEPSWSDHAVSQKVSKNWLCKWHFLFTRF